MIHIGGDMDVILQNIDIVGSGGTGIQIDDDDADVTISGGMRGFETAIVHEAGHLSMEDAMISGNFIGYIAHEAARGEIKDTATFENIFADIIYHPNTDVTILQDIAKNIVRATNESLVPADVELNREARRVLRADDEEETRNQFKEFTKIVIEYIAKGGAVAAGLEYSYRALNFLAQNGPTILEHVPDG